MINLKKAKQEILTVGLRDWVWFVFKLKRNLASPKLNFVNFPSAVDCLNARQRAYYIEIKLKNLKMNIEPIPVSKIITDRIIEAKARYWANDNISQWIEHNEIEPLIDEITEKFESVMDSLIIDYNTDPNSNETPRRLAEMYVNELMYGRYHLMPCATAFPNDGHLKYEGMLVVRAELHSVCSHHHQPVTGVAYIGIISANKLLGLSKYSRIAQWCARRGTLQEELCNQIADEISKITESANIAVHIGMEHGCCTNRGIMAHSSLTQTTVLRGSFLHDPGTKKEFFDNIAMQTHNSKGPY